MITPQLLAAVTHGRAKSSLAGPLAAALNKYLPEYEINTPLRISHFIGQLAVESAYFTKLTENLNYSAERLRAIFPKHFTPAQARRYSRKPVEIANRAYANRMGNGPEASGDGWRYRGRGWIMNTGKANYEELGRKLGLDLIGNPDLAADPTIAVRTACEYWKSRAINEAADRDDAEAATFAVNGGYNHLQERIDATEACKRALAGKPLFALAEPMTDSKPPAETGVPAASETDPLITPASDRDLVKTMQRALKALNYYDGGIDGAWTENGLTDMAVMAVQKRLKLPIDGSGIRLSQVKAAPPFVLPARETAGIKETRAADTPAGNTVRFWDRLQKWLIGVATAIGIPVGGSAIDQAEGGATFIGRIKGIFEPFGGLGWLFTGYTPWLVVIAGLIAVIVIGRSRQHVAVGNHRKAATS